MSSVEEFYAGAGKKSNSVSSGFNNQNRVLFCLISVGLVSQIPPENPFSLMVIRGIHVAFYVGSMYVYRRSIQKIDDTYTSFTSQNDFGMSNTEKAAARNSAKSTINTMLFHCVMSGIFHWRSSYILPLVVSLVVDVCSLIDNETFYGVLTFSPLKKPHNIPRSKSGRLV